MAASVPSAFPAATVIVVVFCVASTARSPVSTKALLAVPILASVSLLTIEIAATGVIATPPPAPPLASVDTVWLPVEEMVMLPGTIVPVKTAEF